MLWITLLMSMALGVFGFQPGFDACPRMPLLENFNLQKFLGKWYEAERYHQSVSTREKCKTSDYRMTENGTVHLIESTYLIRPDGHSILRRDDELINMTNGSKYEIAMYSFQYFFDILSTDYDNYCVISDCLEAELFGIFGAVIYTRDKHPEPAVLENAREIIKKYEIDQIGWLTMQQTNKENCPEDY